MVTKTVTMTENSFLWRLCKIIPPYASLDLIIKTYKMWMLGHFRFKWPVSPIFPPYIMSNGTYGTIARHIEHLTVPIKRLWNPPFKRTRISKHTQISTRCLRLWEVVLSSISTGSSLADATITTVQGLSWVLEFFRYFYETNNTLKRGILSKPIMKSFWYQVHGDKGCHPRVFQDHRAQHPFPLLLHRPRWEGSPGELFWFSVNPLQGWGPTENKTKKKFKNKVGGHLNTSHLPPATKLN